MPKAQAMIYNDGKWVVTLHESADRTYYADEIGVGSFELYVIYQESVGPVIMISANSDRGPRRGQAGEHLPERVVRAIYADFFDREKAAYTCGGYTGSMGCTVRRSDFVKAVETDEGPDLSYLGDADIAKIERGDWAVVRVHAHALISVPFGAWAIEVPIQSPGCGGIVVTDGDPKDDQLVVATFEEECDTLETILRYLGCNVVD